MPKMKVLSNSLSFVGEKMPVASRYPKGSIIDVTDLEREELLKDKTAEDAGLDSAVSTGEVIIIDPVERDVREKNFQEARKSGEIVAPEGAEKIRTPMPGVAEGLRGFQGSRGAAIEPIPGTSSET